MEKCVECLVTDRRLIKSRQDGQYRCQRHYNIFNYGYCSERHFEQVPATGQDGQCESHRHGTYTKIVLRVGDINDFGVEVIEGPFNNGHRYIWKFKCPYCKQIFENDTTSFKKKKSCYECRGLPKRKQSPETSYRQLWGVLKGRKIAKEKGCDITLEKFIEISSQPCYYCGAEPTPSKGHRKWATYVDINGLDRVDNNRGYMADNVVPCCKYCNSAKLDRTQDEFYSWIGKLVMHSGLR